MKVILSFGVRASWCHKSSKRMKKNNPEHNSEKRTSNQCNDFIQNIVMDENRTVLVTNYGFPSFSQSLGYNRCSITGVKRTQHVRKYNNTKCDYVQMSHNNGRSPMLKVNAMTEKSLGLYQAPASGGQRNLRIANIYQVVCSYSFDVKYRKCGGNTDGNLFKNYFLKPTIVQPIYCIYRTSPIKLTLQNIIKITKQFLRPL